GCDAPVPADLIQHRTDGFGPHQRWCTAAKEDRGNVTATPARSRRLDLACKGPGEAVLIDRGMADMAVEVAIGTFRPAERPLHIDAEGLSLSLAQGRSPRV